MFDPWRARVTQALRENRRLAPEDATLLLREIDSGDIGESAEARRHRRDEAIRALAASQRGTPRQVALAIEVKLRRYAAIAFPREIARPDGERGLQHDAINLSGGKALKFDAIYKILRSL